MTLISVYNSEGCVGRCDARCYNATQPKCDCICKGMNHGAGLRMASENTLEMAKKRVEHVEQETGVKCSFNLNDECWQPSLNFD